MSNLLRNIVAYTKYAKYLFHESRKETWEETLARTKNMFLERVFELNPNAPSFFIKAVNAIDGVKFLPSMRAMQFAGEAIERNPQRIFNCMYKALTSVKDISEVFYMLLCGCGVGYSVRQVHISQLPTIVAITGEYEHIIGDTIEGWADAAHALLSGYFETGLKPLFNYSQIRAAGSILKTTGGVAPGPEPLREAFERVENILKSKRPNERLSSLEVSDIICILAHCVLSGGNRRSALIGLFDWGDAAMYSSKHGNWFENYAYRSRANISAMPFYSTSESEFIEYMVGALQNGWGEPGYVFTRDESCNYGVNPCSEIGLRDGGACNLCEINLSGISTEREFYEACWNAGIIGTIQASYTNFSYVSSIWSNTCTEDALLGVGLTGISSSTFIEKYHYNLSKILRRGVGIIEEANIEAARQLGVYPAKRLTTIKPAGSTSCIFECSSGIHPSFAEYYIRRVRVSKNSGVYNVLLGLAPGLIEDALDNPKFDAVLSIPVHMPSPNGFYTKDVTEGMQLDAARFFYNNWVLPGHKMGKDTHNVSLTIHYKPGKELEVARQLYSYRNELRCVSVFPYGEGKYEQQPFEEITRAEYLALKRHAENLEGVFDKIQETLYTPMDIGGACDGGKCEFV